MTRVAVVGGGQIARRVYLPVLAAREDVELAALVEPADERRNHLNRVYRFAQAVASVGDLKPDQADCAFVLTPHEVRRQPVTRLLEIGLDVLCEKPLSLDLREAEELTALAERTGRILMVGFNRRFMPVYRKAKEFVGERRIDVLRAQKQGARLMDHSIHLLDVMRFFCGEPVSIQAEGNFDGDQETLAAAVVRFDSGAVGIFESPGRFGNRMEETELHGAGFTVQVDAPSRAVLYENGTGTVYQPGNLSWFTEAQQLYGFTDEITHFLDCVRTRARPINAAPEALGSHRFAQGILAAMRKGRGA